MAHQQQKQHGENGASSYKIFDRPIASHLRSSKRRESGSKPAFSMKLDKERIKVKSKKNGFFGEESKAHISIETNK